MTETKKVMINADMGESFGNYSIGNDEKLMPYMSLINLACGFHAGDPVVMKKSVELAKKNNITVGAHPGFNDMQGFGRRMLYLSEDELYCDLIYQFGALDAFLKISGMTMNHVCPHGKMDPLVSVNENYARVFMKAVTDYNPDLNILLESKCLLAKLCKEKGIKTLYVGYPDVEYDENGEMIIGGKKNSLNPERVAEQALHMVKDNYYTNREGRKFPITAEVLCFHGDVPNCVEVVEAVRRKLIQNDIKLI
ncbi:MAG: 5-oxoprolinase subunit PxpA [Butyrivibrio sp.]